MVIFIIVMIAIGASVFFMSRSSGPTDIDFNVQFPESSGQGSDPFQTDVKLPITEFQIWLSNQNRRGELFRREEIKTKNEVVYYKTNRYCELFGIGRDGYFPGFGPIFNRTFDVWYQEFNQTERRDESQYRDIGDRLNGPFFFDEENYLKIKTIKPYIVLYHKKSVKRKRIWYTGLRETEFTGITLLKANHDEFRS
jgi:hypothetical protein